MKLRYLLDTSIVSEPVTKLPNPAVVSSLTESAASCAIASLVWHELIYGCERLPAGKRRTSIERYLHEVVLRSFQILPYDVAAADWHASQRARLSKSGTPAPFVDGQIAAIAHVNDLTLVTLNDRDFSRFNDLNVENWFRSR